MASDMPVNLISNPGFETNITGWTGNGTTTLARTTSEFHGGAASLHAVFDGATPYCAVVGGGSSVPADTGPHTWNASVWMKGSGDLVLLARCNANGFSANHDGPSAIVTLSSTWQLVTASVSSLEGEAMDAVSILIGAPDFGSGHTSTADFYVDDAELYLVPAGPSAAELQLRRQFEMRP